LAITGTQHYGNSNLIGWTTTINADDVISFYVRSNSCITKILISMKVLRT
jgi:hypothetical protein